MRLRCRKNYKTYIVFILIFIVSLFGGLVLRRLEQPFVSAYVSYANRIGNEAVNDAITQQNISYDDLIMLKQDSAGRIISLSANTFKINKLKAEISKNVDKNIESYRGKTVKIHLGAAQSNVLASSFGPAIKIKIKPYSSTTTSFRDEFVAVGINQVRHCIYLDINTSVTVAGFNFKKTHKTTNTVMIADTVIVGTVPEFYGSGFSNLNNIKG